jgi:NAD dependent epimerase/dehydratase family enzyme
MVLWNMGSAKVREVEVPSMGALTLAQFQMTINLAISEKKWPTSQKEMIMNSR